MFYVKSNLEVAEELLLKAATPSTTCPPPKQFGVGFR